MQRYDATTALIVVAVQHDFADPSGSLSVRGGQEVVPVLIVQAEAARAARGHVDYTADWHPPRTPHFVTDGGIWPVHCVAGTPGAAFHPDLVVEGPVVRKGTNGEDGYSGFTMRDPVSGATMPTELESILRGRGVRRVIVGGLATDYCVKATALDAARLGFETAVLVDGVRAVDLAPGDGDRAFAEMTAAGIELVDGEGAG
jgi:nicotinamidase/pyrazinamidase